MHESALSYSPSPYSEHVTKEGEVWKVLSITRPKYLGGLAVIKVTDPNRKGYNWNVSEAANDANFIQQTINW